MIIENDAQKFIDEVAMCEKEKVFIEDWLFAFSKLYVSDNNGYKKFINDYNLMVE